MSKRKFDSGLPFLAVSASVIRKPVIIVNATSVLTQEHHHGQNFKELKQAKHLVCLLLMTHPTVSRPKIDKNQKKIELKKI